jgi:hypothetical protein
VGCRSIRRNRRIPNYKKKCVGVTLRQGQLVPFLLKKQNKLIKKHKLQQRILSSMVVIRDTIVPDDSSDKSESSDNTFGDLDINSLVAN